MRGTFVLTVSAPGQVEPCAGLRVAGRTGQLTSLRDGDGVDGSRGGEQ